MTTTDRARKYLAACPGASDGNRDNNTIATACKVVERFELSEPDLRTLLLEWNGAQNHPPLAERDVAKCLRSAIARTAYDPSKSGHDSDEGRRREPPAPEPPLTPLPTDEQLASFVAILRGKSSVASDARAYLERSGIDPFAVDWGLAKLSPEQAGAAGLPRAAAGVRYVIPVRHPQTNALLDVRRYAGGPFSEGVTGGLKLLPWAKGYGTAKPYRFGDVAQQEVVWAEGEKDCEALRGNQILAVTNTCGSGSAGGVAEALPDEALPSEVTILFDADQAGQDGAAKLANALGQRGVVVKVASWPDDSPAGYDVAQWFTDGRPINELRGILAAAAVVERREVEQTPDGLPAVPEAERAIIGAVIFGGLDSFAMADETLRAEHFFDDRNRAVWEACAALAAGGNPITQVSVPDMMRRQNAPAAALNKDYLTAMLGLATDVGLLAATSKLAYHASIVRQAGVVRKLASLARSMETDLLAADAEPEAILDAFVDRSAKALETRSTSDHYHRDNFFEQWLKKSVRRDRRISTGMPMIDASLRGGWWSPHIHGLIARPKQGKSAMFATWISAAADDVAKHDKGEKIGVMSLEMPFEQEMARLVAFRTRIPFGHLEHGPNYLLQRGQDDLFQAAREEANFLESKLVIIDTRGISMTQFRASVSRMVEYEGCCVVFVENVNHIRVPGDKEVDRLTRAVEETNDIAGQLNVPIIGAMQINRAGSGDSPKLENVYGTDALARDCFWAAALVRPNRKHPDDPVNGKLSVLANRGGDEVVVRLKGNRETLHWEQHAVQDEREESTPADTPRQVFPRPANAPDPDDYKPWYHDQ